MANAKLPNRPGFALLQEGGLLREGGGGKGLGGVHGELCGGGGGPFTVKKRLSNLFTMILAGHVIPIMTSSQVHI